MQERNEDQRKKPKVIRATDWKPTQEELLEEALETEKINLKSLGNKKLLNYFFFISKSMTTNYCILL